MHPSIQLADQDENLNLSEDERALTFLGLGSYFEFGGPSDLRLGLHHDLKDREGSLRQQFWIHLQTGRRSVPSFRNNEEQPV